MKFTDSNSVCHSNTPSTYLARKHPFNPSSEQMQSITSSVAAIATRCSIHIHFHCESEIKQLPPMTMALVRRGGKWRE